MSDVNDLAGKIAGDLAAKYGVPVEAIAHAMRAGFDLAEEELTGHGSRRRLAEIDEPAVAAAVLCAVPGVRLAADGLYPERLVSDEQFVRLHDQVRMALRAAQAMRPEPPRVCDSCRKDPPCSLCAHLPRRY